MAEVGVGAPRGGTPTSDASLDRSGTNSDKNESHVQERALCVSTQTLISLISAAVALASALLSLYGIRLAHRLRAQRESQNKEELVADLMARYRDPLLRAAFDLQSKLFNVVTRRFLPIYYVDGADWEREYAVENTLYVLGQYLGWVEILRRDVQFLDLRDVQRNARLVERLDAISYCMLTDALPDPVFRLFLGEQRAIGEVMMQRGGDGERSEVMGYASFVARRQDASFSRWFDRLADDIDTLAKDSGAHDERLIQLQRALVDLIDFLDPDATRFPRERRTRI
jgi:hypothetical protein